MKIFKQYLWILGNIWKIGKKEYFVYCIISFMGFSLPTVVSYCQKAFINGLQEKVLFQICFFWLIAYMVIKFVKSIFQFIDSYFAHKLIYKIDFLYRSYVSRILYYTSQDRFYDPIFNDELERVDTCLKILPYHVLAMNEIGVVIATLIFVSIPNIVLYSPLLLLPIIADAVFAIIQFRRVGKEGVQLEQKMTREQRSADYFGNLFTDRSTAKEIRIFNACCFFEKNWSDLFVKLIHTKTEYAIQKQKRQLFSNLWGFFIYCMIFLLLAFQLINKDISWGTFTFLYSLVPAVSEQCRTLISDLLSDNLKNYYMIKNLEKFISNSRTATENGHSKEALKIKQIELKNVSYRYPTGDKNAVNQISLTVNKGEVISILGYNGSGKTTLSKLITGMLKPMKGEVWVKVKKVEDSDMTEYSKIFGIIYQDFTRYYLTVKDNIGFGYIEKYGEENIQKAFEKAECEEINNKLPKGLETTLGKAFYAEGIDLSGGEWQKLAIARCYMGDHQVFIMDEPTASIDPFKETEMLNQIRKMSKDHTVILISHRIGFARIADRIFLMNNGRLVESGTHDELINKKGMYFQLFRAQKDLYFN